jgi:carbon-monoxide dehydrogenase medium subunit
MAGLAAVVTRAPDGALPRARVAYISLGPGPVVVDLAEAITGSGGGLDPARVRALVDDRIDPEDDIHATADYRRHLAHVLTDRALREAQGRAAA